MPVVVLSDSVCRVQVIAEGLPGGDISLKGSVSSQYLTAILMASPLALGDINITISDTLVSVPYVDMTIQLMQRFGVKVGLSAFKASLALRDPSQLAAACSARAVRNSQCPCVRSPARSP